MNNTSFAAARIQIFSPITPARNFIFQASVDLGCVVMVYHPEDGGIVLANDTSSAATTLNPSAQYQLE